MTARRIRTIKPTLWTDEILGSLEIPMRLLFVGLIGHADDEGRFRAAPALVRSQVFTYDDVLNADVEGWLVGLHDAGRIDLYGRHGGQQYGRIVNWHKHQRIDRPRPSELPGPSPANPIRERAGKQVFRAHVDDPSTEARDSLATEGIGGDKEEQTRRPASGRPAGDPMKDKIVGVFEAWRTLFGKTAAAKLDTKRAARIRWALQAYDDRTVWRVLNGYASDPWRHEQLSRHDLRAILRDVSSVERGLELYEKSKGRGSSSAPAVDELTEAGY